MKFDVKHIAKLANIPLKEEELVKFEKQLSAILEYVKQLDSVEVKDVAQTDHVTGVENKTREDVASPSLSQEEAVSNGSDVHNGFFKVKAILEE